MDWVRFPSQRDIIGGLFGGFFKNRIGINNRQYIDTYTTTSGSATAVVPELEAKLGAMYVYAMNSGDLTFDACYMWVNYFDVLTGDKFGPTYSSGAGTQNDFSLNGVYFGLNWRGNIG